MTDKLVFWPGNPYPLGSTYDGIGVNFSLFSENAEELNYAFLIVQGLKPELKSGKEPTTAGMFMSLGLNPDNFMDIEFTGLMIHKTDTGLTRTSF
jgi:pullulanase/glycogen debranching enzyme